MMTIKLRVDEVDSEHVRVTVFSGVSGQTLHNNGNLAFSTDEYFAFLKCIRDGAMKSTDTEYIVSFLES